MVQQLGLFEIFLFLVRQNCQKGEVLISRVLRYCIVNHMIHIHVFTSGQLPPLGSAFIFNCQTDMTSFIEKKKKLKTNEVMSDEIFI